MKRNLTSAFSTRALLEQESIVDRCVNDFVTTIGSAEGSQMKGLNMTKWYEMISFDILGEMAFGESFHAVESKPHFWSELIVSHLYFITVLDNLRRYPSFVTMGKFLLPFATTSVRDKHSGYTREKVNHRLAAKSPRKDFMTTLTSKVSTGEISKEEMTAHASTLVIAGGETTSTFLAATTYYLLTTPKAYRALQREIRDAFSTYEEIDASSAQKLPYLQAVISEGLRMYAPGSQGFPRVSAGVEIDGHWVPPGAEMYTSAWTVTHDSQYFKDPFLFNPERWIDEDSTDVKEASQPFSLGPRGCLGRNFAYMEMNLILAKLHWTYDFELVDKSLDWEGSSHLHVMWWKPDLWVKVLPRTEILEPYGPNVATAEGKTYQFHVRITAPPFGDMSGANDLVFAETMTQTERLMQSWSSKPSDELQFDVNGLTLAVISMAGFGKRLDWTSNQDDTSNIPSGYDMSFLRAISDTTGYMTAILLLPKWLLRLTPLKCAAVAHENLDRYMRAMIRAERERILSDNAYESVSARGNLLTSILKASALEAAENARKDSSARKEAFTEDEVMGNLFIYLLAGYETTANAILYGLIVLAVRPGIQAKCIAEVDRIYAEAASQSRSTLTYAEDFDKLEYLYGFMYETFRLYPGVIMITKMVKKDTVVTVPGDGSKQQPRSIVLPRECRVYLNSPATQYSEAYWPDPETLDPHRWDRVARPDGSSEKEGKHNVVAADKTRQMRGTFLTFSDGSRACLGRKFAQAEYIAFLATLLREYEVALGDEMDRDLAEKDLNLRCAGKVTLAPNDHFKLKLVKRH
ncbi:uncharacterized protein N0V89_008077 [Didymosphaeria variabile]|uniref:Cytochrome P450 n=1 Tax=Didymosphaeria variabile TaxID=1932322 RepID=A0A9W9C910_9PLEO|nr:uncharacterized protein N0V89_008077 [Didymosphaeria variabile]KAJ4349462.1 hypothetical protein N0V89_008077 [Didymosphaeria variabile]